MKIYLALAASLGLLQLFVMGGDALAQGQRCDAPIGAPGCADAINGSCPTCRPRTCQPPYSAPPPQGAPPPEQAPPLGFFQAPPPTGTVQGASESNSVRGAEITFPEIKLRMPSIHFPHWVKHRTHARMITEAGVAPFVEGQNVAMGWSAQPTPPLGAPPPNQGAPPPRQGTPPPCTSPVPSQGYAPPCMQPSGQGAPRCDDQALLRLEALEAEREALQAKLATLQHALQHVAAADSAPAMNQVRTSQAMPAQPLRQPLPPPDDGARRQQPRYDAEPASYSATATSRVIVEPRMLIVEPTARQPIREPRPPSARITGLRSDRR